MIRNPFAAGLLIPHPYVAGEQLGQVRHMCPAERCGNPPNPFCVWCLGAGDVSEARLAAWQRAQWAAA